MEPAVRRTWLNGKRVAILILCQNCHHERHGGTAPIVGTDPDLVCGCVCHVLYEGRREESDRR